MCEQLAAEPQRLHISSGSYEGRGEKFAQFDNIKGIRPHAERYKIGVNE